MSRELIVTYEAEADILDGFQSYEGKQSGLGSRFLDEIEQALNRIALNPYLYQEVFPCLRKESASLPCHWALSLCGAPSVLHSVMSVTAFKPESGDLSSLPVRSRAERFWNLNRPILVMESETMKLMTRIVATFAAVGSVSSLYAHHSNSMFDMSTHVWLTGIVVRYEPVNPHAIIELEVTEEGRARRWVVEGPNLSRLGRLGVGDFVKAGDVIEVCGFFGKDDVSRDSRVHGHVVITPDGRKWQWGPYGNLERCVNRDEWHTIATGTNPLRDNTR